MKMLKRIAWLLPLFLCVLIVKPVSAAGIPIFEFNAETGTIERFLEADDEENLTQVTIPSTIDGVRVTAIGVNAFGGSRMESVIIPDSVTSIGESAFYRCLELKSITIPDSVTYIGKSAFYGCESLENVEISDSTVLDGDVFLNTPYQMSLDSVCGAALRWILNGSELTICGTGEMDNYFYGRPMGDFAQYSYNLKTKVTSIVIENGVTSIGNNAFSGFTNLTSISLGSGLKKIGNNAFASCTKLETVDVPAGVKTIGMCAFQGTGVSAVTFHEGLEEIQSEAFADCPNLKEASIPKSVTRIGYAAFGAEGTFYEDEDGKGTDYDVQAGGFVIKGYSGTEAEAYAKREKHTFQSIGNVVKVPVKETSLKKGDITYKVTVAGKEVAFSRNSVTAVGTVKVPSQVEIDGITYKVTSIESKAFQNNNKITKVTIGKNVTSIGNSAFWGCTKLKTLTIGSTVKTIGSKAFYRCNALTKVTIPSSVTTIGSAAFRNCTKLAKVTIGINVKSIGAKAFYGDKALKTITIKSTKLTKKNVGNNAFKGIYSKVKIKVPSSKLKIYKTLLKAKGVGSKAVIKK